jgi:hypothetical protein
VEGKNFSGGASKGSSLLEGDNNTQRRWVVKPEDGGHINDIPCETLVTCSGKIMRGKRLKKFVRRVQ